MLTTCTDPMLDAFARDLRPGVEGSVAWAVATTLESARQHADEARGGSFSELDAMRADISFAILQLSRFRNQSEVYARLSARPALTVMRYTE